MAMNINNPNFISIKHHMKWDNLINAFLKTNSELNLSAIRNAESVREKHIMDALEIQKIFPLKDGLKVCDVGT